MIISNIELVNWKNFPYVHVDMTDRVFIVGPNASGKSNLLDAIRFLHDLVKAGGGLQKALSDRGGIPKIRCLAARKESYIRIAVSIQDKDTNWKYEISIKQEPSGYKRQYLEYERIQKNGNVILNRPDEEDKIDSERLTQTHLEQVISNKEFREVADFFEHVTYLHLVPQLVRFPGAFMGPGLDEDPFGEKFLDRIAKKSQRSRRQLLNKITKGLSIAIPQLKDLAFTRDPYGKPHLEATYEHWRPNGARQNEEQFSDGTLRFIALLWSLLESDSLLLLEEPELSLNTAIVSQLAPIIYKFQRQRKRQVIMSTHSYELLNDKGIGAEEVLLLSPKKEGTEVKNANDIKEIKALLESGMSAADATIPYSPPLKRIDTLSLFEE